MHPEDLSPDAVEETHTTQDPKYDIQGGRLVNAATGEPIPEDEPVFIFRGKDRNAVRQLREYAKACANKAHSHAVERRAIEFETFAAAHPERMKEPDTGVDDCAAGPHAQTPPARRVVCAANRARLTGEIAVGPRHFDAVMRAQMARWSDPHAVVEEQGFIDQHGVFMTRTEARQVAEAAGQIIRRVGGDEDRLFSENLY